MTLVKKDLKHDPEGTQGKRAQRAHMCLRRNAGKGKTKGVYFVSLRVRLPFVLGGLCLIVFFSAVMYAMSNGNGESDENRIECYRYPGAPAGDYLFSAGYQCPSR